MIKKQNVVITGGAGFLGSHLCDRFINAGHRVFCVDNLKTGSLRNIHHLRKEKNFSFIKHDVSKPFRIPGKVHYILHFASPASPVDYLKYPIPTLKVGSLGGAQYARAGETQKSPLPHRLDQRSLRRSPGASAKGNLLGQRQLDRPARVL